VTAKGLRSETVEAHAGDKGSFTVAFRHLKPCDSVTVVAAGAKGSRAEFNLSQLTCTGT